jgi:NadR type nicotinamide-nucleotide adenylyltransferase
MLKKIAVIGPESTGKSTLCEQLAEHYRVSWCPEFAREWLLTYPGRQYNYEDLLDIAKGQIALEDAHLATAKDLLFIDTDMHVMQVWCEFVFGKCHKFILQQIVERKYDLFLLCNIDLPWTQDGLREYPDENTRHRLFLFYKELMIDQSTPWVEISGDSDARFATAIAAVDALG